MSLIFSLLMNRLKAIVAFFLTGLATLVIQSIEQGGGFDVPKSTEEWIAAMAAAAIVSLGVYQTPNKPLPPKVPGK